MDLPEYDFSKDGKRWVSCFDRMGFSKYCSEQDSINIFCETCQWLEHARQAGEENARVELAWFSDTIIFYSSDDSRTSFQAVAETSRLFFDEAIDSYIPLRGALAFGDFYADKIHNLFFGNALVDAYKYGEKFDWLGFVIHPTALKRMDEVGQPISDLTYKHWDAEFKNRETNTVETERVVAYLIGLGSIRPAIGGNPYQTNLEEMVSSVNGQNLKRKYENTLRFWRYFNDPLAKSD